MKHIKDLHFYSFEPGEDGRLAIQKFQSSVQQEAISNAVSQIVEAEFSRLEHEANEYISSVAASRAESFFEKLLDGDEKAAMALLGNNDDRDRFENLEDRKPWAEVIRGKLFETSGIQLRRKIVDANKDLITSERIKDLESIVAGLTAQIKELESEIDRINF